MPPDTSVTSDEAVIRRRVRKLLGAEAIAGAKRLRLSYTLRDTFFIYALLALSIGGTIVAHQHFGLLALLGAPVFMLLSGIAFNWINVQIHEASHILLLPKQRANDAYCNLVLGSLALQDVQTYRQTHSLHHAHLRSEADPDLWVYMSHAGSGRAVLRGMIEDLLLITVLKRQRQSRGLRTSDKAREGGDAGSSLVRTTVKLAGQAAILAIYLAGCGWAGLLYYGAFYLYPLVGIFPLLVRIRTVVQHFAPQAGAAQDGTIVFMSRTTESSLWQFILIGGRMDYHFEHHLMPMIPYYGLRDLHRALDERRFFHELREEDGRAFRTTTYLQDYYSMASR